MSDTIKQSKALSAAVAIAFAVALLPTGTKAQSGGAPTDPQIAFEKAYMDNEVAYHQAVINATKTVLIPSGQNAELKSALEGATPLFEGHLQHAERVQSAIEGQASSAM